MSTPAPSPIQAIAYSGADHTRRAGRDALAAILSAHDFGSLTDLKTLYQPDSDNWPNVRPDNLLGGVKIDDPVDERWSGDGAILTRLAVMSTQLDHTLYLGGPGVDVDATFSIEWSVVTTGALAAWAAPVFDSVMGQLGLILSDASRSPSDHWIDLSVGQVELMQFDLGERAALSASIPVTLGLDTQSLFA